IDVAITDEELRREYCLGAELGQGGYGKVVKADKIVRWRRFKRPKTAPVAIKYMPDDAHVAMSRLKDRIIPTEVRYLRKCHHVNIIELLAHYTMLDNEQTSRHVIVMERPAHCLDLFSFLQIQPQGRVKEKVARKIFRDVMRGVDYLDKRGILHNDIKPENILLEVEPADKSSKRPRCSERKSAAFPAIAGPSVEHASASGASSIERAVANIPKVIRAKLIDFGFATGRNADPKVSKFRGIFTLKGGGEGFLNGTYDYTKLQGIFTLKGGGEGFLNGTYDYTKLQGIFTLKGGGEGFLNGTYDYTKLQGIFTLKGGGEGFLNGTYDYTKLQGGGEGFLNGTYDYTKLQEKNKTSRNNNAGFCHTQSLQATPN
ncbi:predicted protein, partial [Nematostella vectensis]